MLDDFLSVADAAALLDITPDAVRQLIARGRLQPVGRFGKRVHMLSRAEVLAYQASHTGQAKRGPARGTRRAPRPAPTSSTDDKSPTQ